MAAFQTNTWQLVLRMLLTLKGGSQGLENTYRLLQTLSDLQVHTSTKLLYWNVPCSMASTEFIIFLLPQSVLSTFHIPFPVAHPVTWEPSKIPPSPYVQKTTKLWSYASSSALKCAFSRSPVAFAFAKATSYLTWANAFTSQLASLSLSLHPLNVSPTLLPDKAFPDTPKKGI